MVDALGGRKAARCSLFAEKAKMAQKLEGDSDQVVEVPVEEMTAAQSSTLYPTYVRTLQEAEEVLNRFENNTKSRFCVWRSPKDFGKAGR